MNMALFGNLKYKENFERSSWNTVFQDEELSSEPSVQNVDFIKDIKEIKTRKV